VRVALIGLGGIADAHLRKLRWMDGVEVAGVCDLSASLADAIAERFGVPFATTDAERLIAEVSPQVVHVLTPPGPHRALTGLALDAGAHVLVEKPIATSWEDYAAMRDAAAAAGRLLVEDFNYRFQRSMLRALDLLRAGTIGEPVTLDVAMNAGIAAGPYADAALPHFGHALPGGALFNFASHPASVVAAVLGPHDAVRTWSRRLAPDGLSDDELRAVVGAGRASATITLTSHARPSSFTATVRGTQGLLEVDLFAQRVYAASRSGKIGRLLDDLGAGGNRLGAALAAAGRVATARNDYVEGLGTLLERFYAAVRGEAPTPLPIAEMDAANRLLHDLFDEGNRL
jgi:predicted dehydrogenase